MSDTTVPLVTADAVVLDIEGTTGSASHVHDVLFPYARDRFADWFAAHRGTERQAELVRQIGAARGEPDLDETGAVRALLDWSHADVKAAPLKAVQSLIWAEGYADGTLTGHVYADVPEALERWAKAGIARYIYSSGARQAQRNWFAHTAHGDLTGLLDGYFDLDNAGGKRDPASYRALTRAIGVPPGSTLFLSDVPAELDAATAAGWQAVLVQRPEDAHPEAASSYPTIRTLAGIRLARQ
ncbi:acireductone synthase [Streptomyces sp. NPDC050315]|uniref:acireductone synthase n=1 Tax=Streptomyces sp. NPDC050315 TaxID=3155039 RepID=UPI003445317D